MRKVYSATELGRLFVTGLSHASNKPSQLHCRVCRKNVSVLTHGHHEVLRHFQGSRRFAHDQRLRLKTPGWRVLDFHGNPSSEDELERQGEKIRKGHLVVHDREEAWTRNEVLVGSVGFRNHFVSFLIHIVVLLLVNHRNWNAVPNSVAPGWLGEGSSFLQP